MRVISSGTVTRSGAGSSRILRHQRVDAEPDGAVGVFRPGANEGFVLFEEIFVELFPPMVERMRLLPQRRGSISLFLPIHMAKLSPKTVRMACLLLGGVLLLLTALMTWMFLLEPLFLFKEARGWRSVPCQILTSRMRQTMDMESGTVVSYVEVEYRYQFEGSTYSSDRYDFQNTGTYFTGSASETTGQRIAKLASATNAICFVNPKNPGEAVLERGLAWGLWFASATFPLVSLLGAACFLVAFRSLATGKDEK
jgi:Protein of unknown function (DUF3592)